MNPIWGFDDAIIFLLEKGMSVLCVAVNEA